MARIFGMENHRTNARTDLALPGPVSRYFETGHGADIAHIARCFAPDATVVDEGQTYQGHAAILAWQRVAQKKYAYTSEPVGAACVDDRLSVTTCVVGNFPGSPVLLDHVFALAGDKFRSLEIG
jgi:hypothetical protein